MGDFRTEGDNYEVDTEGAARGTEEGRQPGRQKSSHMFSENDKH